MKKTFSKNFVSMGFAIAAAAACTCASQADDLNSAIIRVRKATTGSSQVTVEASLKEAEITVSGKVSKGPLGAVIKVDREGAIELRSEAKLSAEDESNVSAKGRARLETSAATDEDLNDQLVISGGSAKLLYKYLQAGRRLSVRINDDGSSIVGQDVVCENEEFTQYVCTVSSANVAPGDEE
jgi:hypothetical protein